MYSEGFYPYEIDQSLRFNDDDSTYLSRTPASTGNRKTWTWSGWVKRGNTGGLQTLLQCDGDSNFVGYVSVMFYNDALRIYNKNSGVSDNEIITSSVYRDCSSWYHIVAVLDTSNATASERAKIYVNGHRVTSFATEIYPPLDFEYDLNLSGNPHALGRSAQNNTFYFDGYMAEVNFVDGQALDASSFGENKSGVWIPKRYSGSYGTNGFYLDFGNSGSLGADSSGNGNNWTPNNLAATDQVLDSPTNNFATLNPLYQSLLTYSEGNLRTYYGGAYAGAEPTMYTGKNEKYYSEELLVSLGGDRGIAVIADNGTESIGWVYNGNTYGSLAAGFVMPTYTTGDIIGYAIDGTTNQVQFYKNGVAAGSAWQFSTTAPLGFRTHMGYMYGGSDAVANFGQDSSFAGQKTAQGYTDANGIGDFYYQPPSGYLALCTANLPDPVAAIDPALGSNPEDHFNTVLWTGDGTSGRTVTGVGFQPDIIYYKSRSVTQPPQISDAVRGVYRMLRTSATDAEYNLTGGGMLQSFDADGFTVGTDPSINQSSQTYVAWNWKAGGTGVSNTVGTLTSTVSANQDLGVSIVTFTTDGTNSNVGTGLSSSAPLDMVIIKRRDSTSEWQVGHRSSGQGVNFAYHLELNSTSALSGSAPYFMGSQATSNGDRIYLASGTYGVSSATWVAYCFQEVDGFSKFGSYTGNGSTDGPFVYCGFRPAFVMIKPTTANHWRIQDSARDNYNPSSKELFPNLSNAEIDNPTDYAIDFVSNGFKFRTSFSGLNLSGTTFIFMAFAEMPFKYANAR